MRWVLAAALLAAGGMAPLVWLNPWRYGPEKQILRDFLRRHPGMTLVTLKRNPRKPGLVLEVTCPPDEIVLLTSFRRAVHQDPALENTFDRPVLDFPDAGWRVIDPSEPPNPPFRVRFLFLAKAN